MRIRNNLIFSILLFLAKIVANIDRYEDNIDDSSLYTDNSSSSDDSPLYTVNSSSSNDSPLCSSEKKELDKDKITKKEKDRDKDERQLIMKKKENFDGDESNQVKKEEDNQERNVGDEINGIQGHEEKAGNHKPPIPCKKLCFLRGPSSSPPHHCSTWVEAHVELEASPTIWICDKLLMLSQVTFQQSRLEQLNQCSSSALEWKSVTSNLRDIQEL